ncbi:MAG: helix-turn-helix domain-containing protein [Actinomycetota bacterium]
MLGRKSATTDDRWFGLAQALDRVGDRWTLFVVRELQVRPRRFGELREHLPGISTNTLADRLREMESDGLIVRPDGSNVVELAQAGRELEETVLVLTRWGDRFLPGASPTARFRPEWLDLTLESMGRDPSLELRMHTGGRIVRVTLADGRLIGEVDRAEEDDDVDLLVSGDPRLLVALAAGYLSIDRAEERGLVVRSAKPARRALERVVA